MEDENCEPCGAPEAGVKEGGGMVRRESHGSADVIEEQLGVRGVAEF